MGQFIRRLQYLLHRRRFDRELQGDMEFHREMSSRTRGSNFGDMLRLREDAREAWGWMWIDRLGQDLRYAARMLRKSPGFTLTAVLVLAIGIGVNVTAFSLFDMAALKPLPVRDPDTIREFERSGPGSSATFLAWPAVAFYRANAGTLAAVMALHDAGLTLESDPGPLHAGFVTANYFTELGSSAAVGRTLAPSLDDAPGAEPVVVLSYRFWQHRFAADPAVVGRIIRLNKKPALIVGVAAREFSGLEGRGPDLWAPLAQQPYFVEGSQLLTDWRQGGISMWGRLKPGVTPNVAEQELRALTAALRQKHPDDFWRDERLPSRPGGYGAPLHREEYGALALAGALMFLILAVACGNLGGLLLARGVAREREIAVRVALGAGRGRIFRQLLTESLLLALLGAVAGLALSYGTLRVSLAVSEAPAGASATPDWRVFLFAIAMGLVSALFFGLTPAMQAARGSHYRSHHRSYYRSQQARQILIAAQVAASCVLLIVAGLLVHAVQHALYTSPGFDYEQVIALDPGLSQHGFSGAAARSYLDTLRQRLREVPGVESVALSSTSPLGNSGRSMTRLSASGHRVDAYMDRIDPEYFHVMKIPLLRGRNLKAEDRNAVIVSESLARLLWPGEDPVGKRLSPNRDTVVGVAGNARTAALQDSDAGEIYYAPTESDLPFISVVVKVRGVPDGVTSSIRAIAGAIDPRVIPEIRLLRTAFQDQVRPMKNGALLASLMGAVAMLLALLGIVGLVVYTVSQRTREVGVRLALGASASHILRAILLRQFLLPVTAGLLVGVCGAAALSQLLRHVLFGISHLDPVSYAGATGILVAFSTLAAVLPARRALGVNPMRALRHD